MIWKKWLKKLPLNWIDIKDIKMTYDERIQEDKQKLAEAKQAIKVLQEKKAAITDAVELKADNKQVNRNDFCIKNKEI